MNSEEEKTPLLPVEYRVDTHYPTPGSFPPAEALAAFQQQEILRRRSQRRKRILRHIFGFLILFFGFRFILHGFHHFQGYHHGYHEHHPHWGYHDWSNEIGSSEYPIPPEFTVEECADWDDGQHTQSNGHSSVQHTFELPVSSDLLFLVARGPSSMGEVNIVQAEEESDSAAITVITHYDEDGSDLLDLIKLCRVVAREGENGIGIFSVRPPRRHPNRHVYFNVTVSLPKGSGESPLVVSNFTTKMNGIFEHHVADLSDSVFFNSISLRGAIKPIQVKSLKAGTAIMETVHSPIEGNFTVNDSLRLSTANARIDASVNMLNKKSSEDKTNLEMDTVNAHIKASVSLFSVDSEGDNSSSDGLFDIRAHTARGSIDVAFPTAPINSTVFLNADTALGSIDVNMHNTFEGAFDVHSTPLDRTEVVQQEAEDPEGKNRKRNLIFDSVGGGSVRGKVFWGDKAEQRGLIRLKTALSHILLKV
ncbi:hypothetical protein GYMLUDRAFT_41375 [Collybiopsis luxurians FD-317 M1]|uniref:DUF7330 domain-containing protein n=1 Tax=Collybiopsis luxurians FD-317 M1 TaxID=944289 RepID=A0A0D0CJS4_9AGAR|nr:hypothetical protein GYMLUDRAFT_41375 [Collybiopsis luxurians FD-317 M1]